MVEDDLKDVFVGFDQGGNVFAGMEVEQVDRSIR